MSFRDEKIQVKKTNVPIHRAWVFIQSICSIYLYILSSKPQGDQQKITTIISTIFFKQDTSKLTWYFFII